jgi:hypothetical protein
MKHAEIQLPYFKQGDDLSHHLKQASTVDEALELHAQQLEHGANVLRTIRAAVRGHDIQIEADTHMIQVSGPDEVIDSLIAGKLASIPIWDETGEDDDQEDEVAPTEWDRLF